MSLGERIMVAVAAVMLLAASRMPIWRIEIWAPQYPEGLVMQIGSDRITGNIDQVNILNHYIGMKKIRPAEMEEFKIAPFIFGLIAACGLAVALAGRINLVLVWVLSLIATGALALTDFFRWNYDYGHNLSPEAPIKIPGLTYQPPLFGHKGLLNIDSYSLPDWGAYLIGCAVLIAAAIVVRDKMAHLQFSRGKKWLLRGSSGIYSWAVIALLMNFLFSGCTRGPDAIVVGEDACANCHMTITDPRFAAEIVSSTGRRLKFDSIECLRKYLKDHASSGQAIYVGDYFKSGTLVKAETARFLTDSGFKGPMGPGTVSSADEGSLVRLKNELSLKSGSVVDWKTLAAR